MGQGSARGSSSSSSPRGRGEEEEEKKTPFSHFLGHIVNTWGVMLVEHVLFGLTYASDVEECTAGIRLVPEIGRTGHRLRRRMDAYPFPGAHTSAWFLSSSSIFFERCICITSPSMSIYSLTCPHHDGDRPPAPLRLLSSPPRSPCA